MLNSKPKIDLMSTQTNDLLDQNRTLGTLSRMRALFLTVMTTPWDYLRAWFSTLVLDMISVIGVTMK